MSPDNFYGLLDYISNCDGAVTIDCMGFFFKITGKAKIILIKLLTS